MASVSNQEWQKVTSRSRVTREGSKVSVYTKIKQDAFQSARRRELRSVYDFEVIWSSLKEDVSAVREFIKETDFPDHLMVSLLNFRGKRDLVPLQVETVKPKPNLLETMNFPALGGKESKPLDEGMDHDEFTWSQVMQAPQPSPEKSPPLQVLPKGLYMIPMESRETFLDSLQPWELRDFAVHPPWTVCGGRRGDGDDGDDDGDDGDDGDDDYDDFERRYDEGFNDGYDDDSYDDADENEDEDEDSQPMKDNPDGLGSLGYDRAFAYKTSELGGLC